MKASEILRKAADVIRARGWYQGNVGSDPDAESSCSVCAVGAMRIAATGQQSPWTLVGTGGSEYWEARAELDETIAHTGDRTPHWNDTDGRTADEVLVALESTAVRLEGEGR